MAALAELMAENGYRAVTIGGLAGRAGVSRGAFYDHFADKEECLLAAYDLFAARIATEMTANLKEDAPWAAFIDHLVAGYLGGLERDPIAARAFLVELDAAGATARARRRATMEVFATLIAHRHAAIIAKDPRLAPLRPRVYLGFVLGVRELAHEALENGMPLAELAPDIKAWITAMFEGSVSTGP